MFNSDKFFQKMDLYPNGGIVMKKVLFGFICLLFATQAFASLQNCKIAYSNSIEDVGPKEFAILKKKSNFGCPIKITTNMKIDGAWGQVVNNLIGKLKDKCFYDVPKFVENDAFATISCEDK